MHSGNLRCIPVLIVRSRYSNVPGKIQRNRSFCFCKVLMWWNSVHLPWSEQFVPYDMFFFLALLKGKHNLYFYSKHSKIDNFSLDACISTSHKSFFDVRLGTFVKVLIFTLYLFFAFVPSFHDVFCTPQSFKYIELVVCTRYKLSDGNWDWKWTGRVLWW